jgi:hypothetical protein
MSEQNFKNHRRVLPFWHLFGGLLLLAFLTCSIVFFCQPEDNSLLLRVMFIMAAVLFIMLYIYCRAFALKAQDRAIRAEENFRHFIITGKPLDPRLRMGQIIALRFAGDDEFPSLAQKAVAEKLPSKEIKKLVRNWRGDYYRV